MTKDQIIELILSFVNTICVLAVVAYLVNKTKLMRTTVKSNKNIRNILQLGILGGLFCIYASCSALMIGDIPVNVRDSGALFAGFLGGPFAGLIAGTIGAVQRFFMGGPTALPCSIATFMAGLFSGLLSLKFGKKLTTPISALYTAAVMEVIHLLLTVFLAVDGLNIVLTKGWVLIPANMIALASMLWIFKKADKGEI